MKRCGTLAHTPQRRKRGRDSDSDSDEANLPRPKRAKRNSRTKPRNRRPRPRASDLPLLQRRLLNHTYNAFRGLVSTQPYQTKEEREQFIDLALARGKSMNPDFEDVEVTEEMRILVRFRPVEPRSLFV